MPNQARSSPSPPGVKQQLAGTPRARRTDAVLPSSSLPASCSAPRSSSASHLVSLALTVILPAACHHDDIPRDRRARRRLRVPDRMAHPPERARPPRVAQVAALRDRDRLRTGRVVECGARQGHGRVCVGEEAHVYAGFDLLERVDGRFAGGVDGRAWVSVSACLWETQRGVEDASQERKC